MRRERERERERERGERERRNREGVGGGRGREKETLRRIECMYMCHVMFAFVCDWHSWGMMFTFDLLVTQLCFHPSLAVLCFFLQDSPFHRPYSTTEMWTSLMLLG